MTSIISACGMQYILLSIPVINRYIFEHGSQTGYQLIEPVDGFHPNQVSYTGDVLRRVFTCNLPTVFTERRKYVFYRIRFVLSVQSSV